MQRHFFTSFLALIASQLSAQPLASFDYRQGATYSYSSTVSPAASLVFSRSFTATDTSASFDQQAASALESFGDALQQAGLSPTQVINIRGYLVAENADEISAHMPDWNSAFNAFFSDNPAPPTRTTIGVSTLLVPDAKIAIDAILAAPASQTSTYAASLANPRLAFPSDSLSAIAPYSSLLITSGVLADPQTPGGDTFGPMSDQTVSTLSKLESSLQRWGLTLADLAFARVLLSPDPTEETSTLDRDGFQEGWNAFWSKKALAAPPFSSFAAPGFSNSGRLIEIEFYAAFPDAIGPFAQFPVESSDPLPPILREGRDASFLSSSVALARDTHKTWFAGVISSDRPSIYGQGVEALLTLEERMSTVGVHFSDSAQLRAYLALDGPFGPSFGRWNRAYKRFFDHPKLTPEKPVRTAFPIKSLPGDTFIEIELLTAHRK